LENCSHAATLLRLYYYLFITRQLTCEIHSWWKTCILYAARVCVRYGAELHARLPRSQPMHIICAGLCAIILMLFNEHHYSYTKAVCTINYNISTSTMRYIAAWKKPWKRLQKLRNRAMFYSQKVSLFALGERVNRNHNFNCIIKSDEAKLVWNHDLFLHWKRESDRMHKMFMLVKKDIHH